MCKLRSYKKVEYPNFPGDGHILVKKVGANWAEVFDAERDERIAVTI